MNKDYIENFDDFSDKEEIKLIHLKFWKKELLRLKLSLC